MHFGSYENQNKYICISDDVKSIDFNLKKSFSWCPCADMKILTRTQATPLPRQLHCERKKKQNKTKTKSSEKLGKKEGKSFKKSICAWGRTLDTTHLVNTNNFTQNLLHRHERNLKNMHKSKKQKRNLLTIIDAKAYASRPEDSPVVTSLSN
uniref:Uncharacterized protein n=1 Tax=Glossina pallidipes TaxID=7398 RepID=A0A1A9Z6G5_GLOPL